MLNSRQKYGQESEIIVMNFLKKKGYKIIERNFRTKYGEIDIIAKDNGTLAFIEVKARKTSTFGSPKESITYAKKKKTLQISSYLFKKHKTDGHKSKI